MAFEQTAFSRTGFCRLRWEASDGVYRYADGLPIVGPRLVVDGVDAVRVTFQWGAQAAADCYVILNTITDRAREHLDDFCMSIGPGRSDARALVCALPADAILSYQKVIVGPSGLDPSVGTDMGEWIRFLEDARPDSSNPLRVVNGRGAAASLFVGPDARVVWPSQDLSAPEMRPAREHEIGARIDARLGQTRQRRIVMYDGEADPTCTLILFDGEIWRGNGVGWLPRRYPGLRVVTIDAGDLDEREAELTDADRVGALLQAVCDETGVGPVMVAGQSYGGLAVLEAALRSDLSLDCAVAQSPSLWWGGEQRGVGEGTLMGDLRTGSVRPRRDVHLRLQVGTLEQTMRPVVDDCAQLLQGLGAAVEVDHYRSGHDVAWWREGLVRALDEWWARP
ncbi:enterochelin esterase domain-containing protein [Schaalia odontolytica]|uniref:DUF3327 domain-containing protein n=2 Tax=Schaalia odontolytica TaxID=1660 RepID=A0A857A6K3_9ACTO|nr:alpha/beta hydrolase-fold protein [Schaalia odontolytica]EFF79173.1 putative esterase [Schaalia odontolytica F0309]QGS10951.1 DUF3327 domain-containing protein [Schaalia odontolytica]